MKCLDPTPPYAMAGFVSSVGLMSVGEARVRGHRQPAVFLGMTMLAMAIAADSPVADESRFLTQYPMEFLGDVQSSRKSSASALPVSTHTTFASLDSPRVQKTLSEPSHEASIMGGYVASENSKYSSHLLAETTRPSSIPSLSPSKPQLISTGSPHLKALEKNSTNLKVANTASAQQSYFTTTMSLRSQLQSQLNISIASSSPSTFLRSKSSQLGLNSEQKTTFSKQQGSAPERRLASLSGQSLKPLKMSFTDPPTDKPYIDILDVNKLSTTSDYLVGSKPSHAVNMLPHADKTLAPGYSVPFIAPHYTSPLSDRTEVYTEDIYPTNTMDFELGSGDYLETMSFLNSEGDDYYLVTKVPSDSYDLEDYTESYDTSFPFRVAISPSSMYPVHVSLSVSPLTTYTTIGQLRSIDPSSISSTIPNTLDSDPTANSDIPNVSDIDWPDSLTVHPTNVLLPDMNSLEYYTTQLSKDNISAIGAELGGNVTVMSTIATDIQPTSSFTKDLSGFEPHDESNTLATTEESPPLSVSEPLLYPSIVPTDISDPLPTSLNGLLSATDLPVATRRFGIASTTLTDATQPIATPLLPDDAMFSSSLTDVHWFVTASFSQGTIDTTADLSATVTFSPVPTETPANITDGTTAFTFQNSSITTEIMLSVSSISTEPMSNVTVVLPDGMSDQRVTEDGVGIPATMSLIPTSGEDNSVTDVHTITTGASAVTEASTSVNMISTTNGMTTSAATTSRRYLCTHDRPAYLVKIGFLPGATVGFAKSQLRDILKGEFNKSVELQVVDPPPKFVFRAVSGPVVYTAISVINALRRSDRRFLSVSTNWIAPDRKHQIHTVLQFVPSNIDVRFCNFSESIERGLTRAFAEVCRRSKESTNFTVHIINITMAAPKYQEQPLVRLPVDITFTIRGSKGYLTGSEVSNALMTLTMVEFSYYMGFPVLQLAEPFHYPELNTTQLLRSSWLRTVLLGVLDQKVGERTFQANMERRVAMLLGEATGPARRVKRATTIGNNSVQVVSASRLVGADHPLEVVYFVEDPSGQRMPADQAAHLLNSMDVQRAAIILGYRVQGILAQPVEKVPSSPPDAENSNVWIVIGVVIPLLVVVLIISILYWKLCRTDKLEFQPDAMTSIQQRQKLQAPSVKGFDFAKLHLGQQSKDEVAVIQESAGAGLGPGPPPMSAKDGLAPSENGQIPTPIGSSTKPSRGTRRRERISPSDGDSVISDHSSERELSEENLRAHATPSNSKQTRPPPVNEQLSSASIFEHVDRMSRAVDASRRLPNKIQLIAMQPMAVPPVHSPPIKLADNNQINKEIQVALRHKSEIEHHRNKIRLRAKRKGHYDFPAMDDITGSLTDTKDQDRIYQKAQLQIDKILDPDAQMASIFMGCKKSGRGRRSPKQRMKEQLNGGMIEADKDHLITEESDAAYRKCPGVNNVAYVSDPDQGQGSPQRSPSPADDVFLGPGCSPPGQAPPPPPYMPPQPTIEEARQQMHSLLDDAFSLVSPTSPGSSAGITLPGVNSDLPACSPLGRSPRAWGSSYAALGPFPGRFSEPPPSTQGLIPRRGLGSSYLPPGETAGQCEHLQPDSLYGGNVLYTGEMPPSARPRPVGGTAGAELHHLTQVGLSNRMNGYPAGVRAAPGPNGGLGWNHYHEENFCRTEPEKEPMTRSGNRESSAPPLHLDRPEVGYLSAPPPLNTAPPPTHSSASLIKAIREELLRLSQKQAAVPSYHS
ncbi:UPF0606 protein KIAA1549 [Brachionichthys hirsutus]|uniref:UPF0606 protein KIAA1549 n=1 Tax=Brachionichthys hirsutus TaxID=412623 RepID=UPI003604ECFC